MYSRVIIMSHDVNINSGALATRGYQTVNMSPVFFLLIDSTYLMCVESSGSSVNDVSLNWEMF